MLRTTNYDPMQKKRIARSFLSRYERSDLEIESLIGEIKKANEKMYSLPPIQLDKPSVQTSKKQEAYYEKFFQEKEQLENLAEDKLAELVDMQIEVRKAIEMVQDRNSRIYLCLKHIHLLPWSVILDFDDVSEKTSFRYYEKGLLAIFDLLEKEGKIEEYASVV